MPTGPELIDAIEKSGYLKRLKQCVAVPRTFGQVIYETLQTDEGPGTCIRQSDIHQLASLLQFAGSDSETAVWNFLFEGTPEPNKSIYHYVVIVPWKNETQETVYTAFMAYENEYTLKQYITHSRNAPKEMGYRRFWTEDELSSMFSDLLTSPKAWLDYFGNVVIKPVLTKEITCWKYPNIDLATAITNVRAYG